MGEAPGVMRVCLLSRRAYDETGMMVDVDVAGGARVEPVIDRLLANQDVSYIHVHNAKRG